MTDREKLDAIRHIVNVNVLNVDDDKGDKYLSDKSYAMEAIEHILNDVTTGITRQFAEATIPDNTTQTIPDHVCPVGTWHLSEDGEIYAIHPDQSSHLA
jgi:hypothetical protein